MTVSLPAGTGRSGYSEPDCSGEQTRRVGFVLSNRTWGAEGCRVHGVMTSGPYCHVIGYAGVRISVSCASYGIADEQRQETKTQRFQLQRTEYPPGFVVWQRVPANCARNSGQLCHGKKSAHDSSRGMKRPRSYPRPMRFTPTPPPGTSPASSWASEVSPPEHEGYPPAPSLSSACSAWWSRWPNGPSTP